MNTSEYNASLESGEKPVGSGAVARTQTKVATSDGAAADRGEAPSRTAVNATEASKRGAEVSERLRKAISERDDEAARKAIADQEALSQFAQRQSDRSEGEQPRAPVLSAADRAAGITPQMIERPKLQPAPNVDPMKDYRRSDGYKLETPVNGPEFDDAVISDWGSVSVHIGLSQEAAQNVLGVVTGALTGATSREREALVAGGGEYDPHRTVTELRFDFGAELEPTLGKIEKFCAKHPSLATYLDSTGLGNSPEVLRMLAGAATVGTTPAAARAFIDKVNGDSKHPYWKGNRLAVAQMKWAYAIAGANHE